MDRPAPAELEIVRAFVNTREIDKGTDRLADSAETAAWFATVGLLPAGARLTSAAVARIVQVREAFRAVLVANAGGRPADEAVEVLNRLAGDAGVVARLSGPATATHVVAAGGVDGALGRLVAITLDAIAAGTWTRLKACTSSTCHWAFYDTSRNRSSRWCDMGVCGNRAKRETFRRRHQ